MSWLTRRAISLSTITLYVKHYKDNDNVEHIDIDQRLTGGLPGTTENRTLDWTCRENSDYLFGPVLGRSRRVSLDRIDNDFLRKGWLPDTEQHGAINSYVKSDTPKSNKTWIAEQVCGPFRHVIASLVYKSLTLFRPGDSKKSMAKGAMFDMSISSARTMSTFKPVWSTTSVSAFY